MMCSREIVRGQMQCRKSQSEQGSAKATQGDSFAEVDLDRRREQSIAQKPSSMLPFSAVSEPRCFDAAAETRTLKDLSISFDTLALRCSTYNSIRVPTSS